jgi:large subunit ribosomal protein L24
MNKNIPATIYKIRLKKGDTVMVLQGKDKGKTGKVVTVHPRDNKVTVEGVNIVKKHQKPNRAYPQGGIVEITKPIWVSKVGIVDPESKKPTRIGFKLDENAGKDGKTVKSRIFKSSGKVIPSAKQKGEQ